jgi:hypothetical protein
LAPASSIIEKLAQSSAHVQLNINNRKEFVQRKHQSVTYAGTYRDGDKNKTIAVLEIPPVDSPESAVKVAIAAKGRKL